MSDEAQRRSRAEQALDLFLRVSKAIGSIMDIQELVTRLMEEVTNAFDADRSTFFVHDPVREELWSTVAQGAKDEIRIPDRKGLSGRAFHSKESTCITDTFEEPMFSRSEAEKFGYVPRSMLISPVIHRNGQCGGVIQVMDHREGEFTEQDRVLLDAIATQVGISMDNARLYEAQKRQFYSFVLAFSTALDARDKLTALHSVNVANYAVGLAHSLGMGDIELEWLRVAGLLHDIGKIGVPEAVLTKPGRLTDEEYVQMKTHASFSREILQKIEFTEGLEDVDKIASAHHEMIDGSGYPDGLKGDELPFRARILAVADIFDALTQDRHYRKGMPIQKAFSILEEMVPDKLDERCVHALRQFMNCPPEVEVETESAED